MKLMSQEQEVNCFDSFDEETSIGSLANLEEILSYALELTNEHLLEGRDNDRDESDGEESINLFEQEDVIFDGVHGGLNSAMGHDDSLFRGPLQRERRLEQQRVLRGDDEDVSLDELMEDLYLGGHDSLRMHRSRLSHIVIDAEAENDNSGLESEEFVDDGDSQQNVLLGIKDSPLDSSLEENTSGSPSTMAISSPDPESQRQDHPNSNGGELNQQGRHPYEEHFCKHQEQTEEQAFRQNSQEEDHMRSNICRIEQGKQQDVGNNDGAIPQHCKNNKTYADGIKNCDNVDESSFLDFGKAMQQIGPIPLLSTLPHNGDSNRRIKNCAKNPVSVGCMPTAA